MASERTEERSWTFLQPVTTKTVNIVGSPNGLTEVEDEGVALSNKQ
jgi:hypothetical protein